MLRKIGVSIITLLMLIFVFVSGLAAARPATVADHTSPYIALTPSCSDQSSATVTIYGFNWPTESAIQLFWANKLIVEIPTGHAANFTLIHDVSQLATGVHLVRATSGPNDSTVEFQVPCPAATPVSTRTPFPTMTPTTSYLSLSPACADEANFNLAVRGAQWDTNQAVDLYWNGDLRETVAAGHGGFFTRDWQLTNQSITTHTVTATNGVLTDTVELEMPCPIVPTRPPVTATPWMTPTPTAPYTIIDRTCVDGPTAEFIVQGANWDNDAAITLFWQGKPVEQIPAGHAGHFWRSWTFADPGQGHHQVTAGNGVFTSTRSLRLPCSFLPENDRFLPFLPSH